MNRQKITDTMKKYLEDRLNCENVMEYIDKKILEKAVETNAIIIRKLLINDIPVTVEIINYNDTENTDEVLPNNKSINKQFKIYDSITGAIYTETENTDEVLPNNNLITQQFKIYDFITEANYTGFEYFPYLYGVLNCHDKNNSRLYVFREYFEGNLLQLLLTKLEHPSEWYDIIFQLVMINYYIKAVNKYNYNGYPGNHLYNKLSKPIYQNYKLDNYEFNINHKYLIVLWDLQYLNKINNTDEITNIDLLLKMLEDKTIQPKIPPSARILKLLHDIQDNPENVLEILDQYYNVKAQTK